MRLGIVLVFAIALAAGCVRAPSVSVVDTRTALEQQAAGEYHALENDLDQEGMSPGGEPIPAEQLTTEQGGASSPARAEAAQLYAAARTDADWIDDMLVAGCVGEATSGLLEPVTEHCNQPTNGAEVTRILGRQNLHRRQIWQLVRRRRPNASEAAIVADWRNLHLQRVVCGGLVQGNGGGWEAKKC